jgi:hypothetical protein
MNPFALYIQDRMLPVLVTYSSRVARPRRCSQAECMASSVASRTHDCDLRFIVQTGQNKIYTKVLLVLFGLGSYVLHVLMEPVPRAAERAPRELRIHGSAFQSHCVDQTECRSFS